MIFLGFQMIYHKTLELQLDYLKCIPQLFDHDLIVVDCIACSLYSKMDFYLMLSNY